MALNEIHAWLVAYDIANDRRRARIHKAVSGFAIPVQYSLYLAIASQNQINARCQNLQSLIHPKQDDIRVYRIPDDPEFWMLGYSRCEVLLSSDGALSPGLGRFLSRLTQPRPRPEYTDPELAEETAAIRRDKIGERRCKR
jgi:CRISPR-associated protein Cas2